MQYEIKLTTQALEQIKETTQYISKTLMEPEIAKRWAATLKKQIEKLNFMPLRFPLTKEEPWHSKGIHKMPVKNYLVYYLINEEEKTVWVTAVVYERRNQISALLDMSLKETEF